MIIDQIYKEKVNNKEAFEHHFFRLNQKQHTIKYQLTILNTRNQM